MGKSTISMAIFNSYFDITRGYLLKKTATSEEYLAPENRLRLPPIPSASSRTLGSDVEKSSDTRWSGGTNVTREETQRKLRKCEEHVATHILGSINAFAYLLQTDASLQNDGCRKFKQKYTSQWVAQHDSRNDVRSVWSGCFFLNGYGSIPINTIFRGMNIHLPAILMFSRGTRFWHTAKFVLW